ncbi:MAG: EF-hand domain-containing protein [Planctomycetota bacterium]
MTRTCRALTAVCLLISPMSLLRAEPEPAKKVATQDLKLPKTVTFSEHIASIVFNNCTSCHRPGEAAPFKLETFKDVKKRGRMIRSVTKSRYMPPWHPVPGHGELADSRRMTDREIALIDRWVQDGMEEGDPEKLPKMPEFPSGWQLGDPDMVVTMKGEYEVPAGGPDIYRNFVIPLDLDEDKWVKAVAIRPGARTVVHHCLYFLDSTGAARKADARSKTEGFSGMGFKRTGSLGGWAVGGAARFLPGDLAMPLAKGSDLVLSTHFHPSGKAEKEKTTIGLYFAKKPPSRTLVGFQTPPAYGALAGVSIAAGDKDFWLTGKFEVPVDIDIIGVSGHAHYLCKTMNSIARLPDGKEVPLFRIDDWDFNWQGNYFYKEAIRLPKGTIISSRLTYDNSAGNPRQPHEPPRRIRWGLESTDEMGSVIFTAVAAKERDYRKLKSEVGRQRIRNRGKSKSNSSRGGRDNGGGGRQVDERVARLLRRLDKNGDGKLVRSEVPRAMRRIFDRVDEDSDGEVDLKDFGPAPSEGEEPRRRRRR